MTLQTFTLQERLILCNQYEILKHLQPEQAEHYQQLQRILSAGYTTLYYKVSGTYDLKEFPEEDAAFVKDVLDMYRGFEHFKESGGKLPDNHLASFQGFDGNGKYYSFANFLIKELGLWEESEISDLNAHMPIENCYRRMLEIWRRKPVYDRVLNLTSADIQAIIAAGPHPS